MNTPDQWPQAVMRITSLPSGYRMLHMRLMTEVPSAVVTRIGFEQVNQIMASAVCDLWDQHQAQEEPGF